jgi:hypothetical protein
MIDATSMIDAQISQRLRAARTAAQFTIRQLAARPSRLPIQNRLQRLRQLSHRSYPDR